MLGEMVLWGVKVGAQLGVVAIWSVGWTVLMLGGGPSSVASLQWVLLGKPPLDGTTEAANVVIECDKPLLLPCLERREAIVDLCLQEAE